MAAEQAAYCRHSGEATSGETMAAEQAAHCRHPGKATSGEAMAADQAAHCRHSGKATSGETMAADQAAQTLALPLLVELGSLLPRVVPARLPDSLSGARLL
jgi:hypothetical protein